MVYELLGQNVVLTCHQVFLVIPYDYKDSSLPVGMFIWEVENNNEEPVDISIVFSLQNAMGAKEDKSGEHWNEPFALQEGGKRVAGVLLHHCTPMNPFTLAVASWEKVRASSGSRTVPLAGMLIVALGWGQPQSWVLCGVSSKRSCG
nr:non-lysosomal glucosylceramidase-like [Anas platyrhynchos]